MTPAFLCTPNASKLLWPGNYLIFNRVNEATGKITRRTALTWAYSWMEYGN